MSVRKNNKVISSDITTDNYYTKTEIDNSLNNKMNITLDNLNQDGINQLLYLMMPDFSRSVKLSTNTTYTADQYGWVMWRCYNVTTGTLTINDTNFGAAAGAANHWADSNSIIVPISIGDTYKASGASEFIFFPCKGNLA